MSLASAKAMSNSAATMAAMIDGRLSRPRPAPIGQVRNPVRRGSLPRARNQRSKRSRLVADPISPT